MAQQFSGVDPNVLGELRPEEQVLWWGRPDPKRRVLQNRARVSPILLGLAVVLVVVLGCFDGVIFANLHYVDALILVGLVLVNGGLLFSIVQIVYTLLQTRNHLGNLRHTIYAITNQRALIMTVVPGKTRGVVSYAKSDIGTISRHEGKEGWGDLVFGTPRPSIVLGRRVMAAASFGGIPQVRVAEGIMFQTFKRAEKAAQQPAAGEQVPQE